MSLQLAGSQKYKNAPGSALESQGALKQKQWILVHSELLWLGSGLTYDISLHTHQDLHSQNAGTVPCSVLTLSP